MQIYICIFMYVCMFAYLFAYHLFKKAQIIHRIGQKYVGKNVIMTY